ncbi:hypothetical protein JCM10450v2_003242 [Rhodotorula kratochvilovae]
MTNSGIQKQTDAFARLPDELLLGILEHIDRPLASLTDKERVERLKTLYTLCLVSKRFYEVAQPVLWRQMELQPSWTRRWDQQALDRAVAAMQAAPESAKAFLSFRKVVNELPNVEDVKIRDLSIVDLSEISSFSKLLRLDAVERIFPRLSTPVSFPHLTTLKFHSVGLDYYMRGGSIFTPATMPALRHLALHECTQTTHDYESHQVYQHFPVLSRAFIEQLEDLQMDVEDRFQLTTHHFPAYGIEDVPPVLFHVDVTLGMNEGLHAVHPPVHYLQVAPPDIPPGRRIIARVVADFLSRGLAVLPHLRLVLLPCMPSPTAPLSQELISFYDAVATLAQGLRGIEVRTYDPGRPLDELVVPEFREFLREQAAGKGA